MKPFKIALALGGGGARGLSNIGILQVLEANNIKPDIIVGTSMGAIIGSLYALHGSASIVKDIIVEVLNADEFKKLKTNFISNHALRPGLQSEKKKPLRSRLIDFVWKRYIYGLSNRRLALFGKKEIKDIINLLIPDINIEDIPKKFACVATNLNTGEPELFKTGSLREAILASTSIPGIFPPVCVDGNIYTDGGIVSSVPVEEALQSDSDFIIGVDVRTKKHSMTEFKNAYDVVSRSNHIAIHLLNSSKLKEADYILSPDVHSLHWANFAKYEWLIEQGNIEATAHVKEISHLIHKKRRKTFLSRLIS